MNIETATAFVTANKGQIVTVTFRSGHVLEGRDFTGELVSVNSKGFNVKIDGKVRTTALRNVEDIQVVTAEGDDFPEDLHDGMTTAELAAHLDTTPKALRVSLRALGMGVGKGRKYSLSPSAYTAVKNHLATTNA